MKYYSLIFPILLLAGEFAKAQNPAISKRSYKISITDSATNQTIGYLSGITDSTLVVSHFPVRFGSNEDVKGNYREVSYLKVTEMRLKRSHGAGRGAWKGAVIGLLVGVAAGFIEGDDSDEYWMPMTAAEKAIIYGGLGATAGAGVGALIGALAKKKFTIGRDKKSFDAMKVNVLNMVYGPKL